MPTYVYESVPEQEGLPVNRYELWQHMKDEPLERHPETGERIKRIIVGGIGLPGSITDAHGSTPPHAEQHHGETRRVTILNDQTTTEKESPPAANHRRTVGNKTALCQLCGEERPMCDLLPAELVRPSIARVIEKEHPSFSPSGFICLADLNRFRSRYVKESLEAEVGEISAIEEQVLTSLRERELLSTNIYAELDAKQTLGERLSDKIATFGGSWRFIIFFGAVLLVWIVANSIVLLGRPFDPYPFILLNLVLSALAAVQAPIILMSQNRMEARDRLRSENDYKINLKAELEIRHLHEKVDHLVKQQWQRLMEIQQIQLEFMKEQSERK